MPGDRKLPVYINTTVYREYEYESEMITEIKAAEKARSELKEITDGLLEDSEILSQKISDEITENEYILHFDAVCLKDIAKVKEFEVEENPSS